MHICHYFQMYCVSRVSSCTCVQVKGLLEGLFKRPAVEHMTLLRDVTGYLMPGTLTFVVGTYATL